MLPSADAVGGTANAPLALGVVTPVGTPVMVAVLVAASTPVTVPVMLTCLLARCWTETLTTGAATEISMTQVGDVAFWSSVATAYTVPRAAVLAVKLKVPEVDPTVALVV